MFRQLFERSADAIFLFDPRREVFVDCNAAAVELMRATSKEQLLLVHPAELSPEFQPDGQSSREKTPVVIEQALSKGSYRFEWRARRMDGTECPLEVLLTPVQTGEHPLMATVCRDITERKAHEAALRESEQKFRELFEASSDAIQILDPQERKIIDCNAATVRMAGGGDKDWFLKQPVGTMSPERQPDGRLSRDAGRAWAERALRQGPQRFEWVARRHSGEELPVEVLLTPVDLGGRRMLVSVSRDISEQKKTQRELLELNQSLERRVAERTAALTTSEARFRALVEHAPEAIVVFDGDTGRFLFGNDHACRLYGVPMEKLATLTPADVSPEFQPGGRRSSQLAREKMDEALAGGTPVFEWTHQRPDGHLIPTEVRLLRLPAEGQNLIRASIIDNTERKQAEHALREANRKLRREIEQRTRAEESLNERVRTSTLSTEVALALNAGTEPQAMLQQCAGLVVRHLDVAFTRIWTLNEATQTLELQASAGCYTHLDGPHSRVRVGQYKIGLIAQEKKPHLTNSVQSDARVSDREWATREGMVAFAGYPLLLEDRVLGVLALFARRPLGDDILKALGSVADSLALGIERKRAQTALAESEMRFSAAFHSSPIITGITRASDGRFVLVNDASLNWSGYSREEVLGRTAIELGIWEDPGERQRFWDDARRSGSIRERECRLRNRHGSVSTMLASGAVIEINGEDHLLVMMVDISQRKQAEAELHRTLAREMELSQLKGNFVSMVSHEFRTPLGIIQSSAELLRDFYQKMQPAERNEQLESITRNTRRMAGMMEEILVLSRLDAGKLDFQPAPLDLNTFCRRVVDEVLSATNRRCLIELSLTSVPPEAKADERLLGHIFTNLLSNAVKYSEPGALVRFSAERDEADAVCMVSDQGIGIAGADQEHLFTAFHRGGNVGTRPGTGLGLLVVKRCVELHRGNVQLVSSLGEGTTVIVRLPVFGKDL